MSFESATARDLNVLIHKESGFINYTKLCKDLSGGKRQSFMILVRSNPGFQKLVLSMEEATGATAPTEITMEKLIEFKVLFSVKGGSNHEAEGTYGPRYMLDYLIFHFKPEYYKVIHSLLESFDDKAHFENKTLEEELRSQIYRNEEALKEKDDKISQLEDTIEEMKSIMLQMEGRGQETDAKLDELLGINLAQETDMVSMKDSLRTMGRKIDGLNAGNYNDNAETRFVMTLFTSEAKIPPRIAPEDSMWLYCQIREDIYSELPFDANVVFEANVVSRAIYKTLMTETRDLYIETNKRHILLRLNNAAQFIQRINEILNEKSLHPETVNLEYLLAEVATRQARERLKNKREAALREIREIKQHIIDSGEVYIYVFARYRRLYNKDADNKLITELDPTKPFFIRKGPNGNEIVELKLPILQSSKRNSKGDSRINYE